MTIFKRLKTQKPKMNDCGWLSEVEKLQITAANSGIVNEGITESWLNSCHDNEDSGRLRHPLRSVNQARVPCLRRKSPNPTSTQHHLCRLPRGNTIEAEVNEFQRVMTKSSPEYFQDQGGIRRSKRIPLSLNSRRRPSVAHAPVFRLAFWGGNHTEPPRLLSFPSNYHPAFLVAVLSVATFNPPRFSKSPHAGELEAASINCGYSSSGRPVASDVWPHFIGFFAEQRHTTKVERVYQPDIEDAAIRTVVVQSVALAAEIK
jgi:hypothetical protein